MREWLARQAGLCVSTRAAGHTTPPSASVKETALGSSQLASGTTQPLSSRNWFASRRVSSRLIHAAACDRTPLPSRPNANPLCGRPRPLQPVIRRWPRSAARPSRLPCRVLPRTRVCRYLCESHPGRGLLYHTVALLENRISFGSCLLFAAAAGSFPTPTSALRGSRVSVLTNTREAVEVVARGREAISPRGSLASPDVWRC